MFGISWPEFMMIALIGLMLIGPKELPEVLRGAGRLFGKIKCYTNELQSGFQTVMTELELQDIEQRANSKYLDEDGKPKDDAVMQGIEDKPKSKAKKKATTKKPTAKKKKVKKTNAKPKSKKQ